MSNLARGDVARKYLYSARDRIIPMNKMPAAGTAWTGAVSIQRLVLGTIMRAIHTKRKDAYIPVHLTQNGNRREVMVRVLAGS